MGKEALPKLVFNRLHNVQDARIIDNDFAVFDHLPDTGFASEPIRLEPIVFCITLAGSGTLKINLQEYDIRPRMLVALLSEHILQDLRQSPDFKGLFIAVSQQFIEDTLPRKDVLSPATLYILENPCTPLADDEFARLKEWYYFLQAKVQLTHHPFRDEMMRALISSVFYDVSGIFQNKQRENGQEPSRHRELFSKFLKLVSQHCHSERSVNFYAERLCLTPKYLSSTVKEVSGRTALEWITGYALIEAKVQLRSTDRSIQEIAGELNYPNQSFFGKYFKHYTGMSPGQYRDRYKHRSPQAPTSSVETPH